MQETNVFKIKEFSAEKFLKKVPLNTNEIAFNVFFFKFKQTLPSHKHPKADELFFVVEGNGIGTVGTEKVKLEKGSAMYGPANIWHGIENPNQQELIVISVQGPKALITMEYSEFTLKCPVCEFDNIITEDKKEGYEWQCPVCQVKLKMVREKGKLKAVRG